MKSEDIIKDEIKRLGQESNEEESNLTDDEREYKATEDSLLRSRINALKWVLV